MTVTENASLRSFNTFGVEARARHLTEFASLSQLEQLARETPAFEQNHLFLGGGSNVLFTRDFDGWVLLNRIPGVEVVEENESHVWLKVGAGVGWHELVMHSVSNGWGGIENLSLIPGKCGAAPMQNIGAYGVEIKDVFDRLQAYHIRDRAVVDFSLSECQFGYRESVFKNKEKGNFAILNITLRLDKNPKINTGYGAITSELEALGVHNPSVADVSRAVMNIRQSKLPDPAVLGNAGSFFKNPLVTAAKANELRWKFPDMVAYAQPDGVKLAAGWLIEKAGMKGLSMGNCGVHDRQALVLVNHGGASGNEIFTLSEAVISKVQAVFGVRLEREVNVF